MSSCVILCHPQQTPGTFHHQHAHAYCFEFAVLEIHQNNISDFNFRTLPSSAKVKKVGFSANSTKSSELKGHSGVVTTMPRAPRCQLASPSIVYAKPIARTPKSRSMVNARTRWHVKLSLQTFSLMTTAVETCIST